MNKDIYVLFSKILPSKTSLSKKLVFKISQKLPPKLFLKVNKSISIFMDSGKQNKWKDDGKLSKK